jgi:hypothetical protein
LCTDRGGEFILKEKTDYQDTIGTLCELTVHDSPPQNGVSEHGMHSQAELARALLIASRLPRFLWEEPMSHIEWVKERTLHSALEGKTLYKMKHKKKKPHLVCISQIQSNSICKRF